MEEKILKVFEGFPNVTHVWVDDKDIYFDERPNCRKVTREETSNTKTKKSNGK